MIKKVINNFLEVIKLVLKNKTIILFMLSVIGATNAGQYFFIPPHLHYKSIQPIVSEVIKHKTIIKKVECGERCKASIKEIVEYYISQHIKTEH